MTLHALEGHEAMRTALIRATAADTLPASLLIRGPRGVGKQRLALWLGQLQLCDDPGPEGPCDRCRSCRLALKLEHPDLHWHFPVSRPRGTPSDKLAEALEEARYARLAELRQTPLQASVSDAEPTGIYLAAAQTLRKRAQSRPSMSRQQIFIIADAEMLVPQESSQEAANALLKLLEEPPTDTRFMLTSSEPGSLLDTIRSRTVPVHLGPLDPDRVARFLTEAVDAEPDQARRAARLGQGSIGRALGFLHQADGSPGPLDEVHREAYRVLEAALAGDAGAGYLLAMGYRPAGARGLLDLLAEVEGWVRDLGAVAAGAPQRAVDQDAVPTLADLAAKAGLHPEAATRALAVVDEAALEARGNVNPQLIITGMVAGLRARLCRAA